MKQWSYTNNVLKTLAGLLVLTLMLTIQPGQSLAQMDQTKPDPAWLQNMHQNIEQYSGLDTAQREQMRANLDRCLALGMGADRVDELFPQEHTGSPEQARDMLMMQDRILAAGESGLPLEPMIEKMREGRMKHVRSGMMTQVLDQTDHNLRVSDRMTREVVNGGVKPSGYPGEMHNAVVDLSRCLWDGLHEEDMEHLGERARMRAQSGGCGLGEFVAANEAAARFAQSGMDHSRAVDMAGEALHNGYSAQDMSTMGNMMMAGSHWDGDHQEMMESMDGWIHEGMSMDEMTEHMMDGGWMGPADMMGPGGSHPMNDMGMGGAGHDGGMGGDHDHGGMGGDGGGMGGGGGGMGGDGGGMGGGK